MATNLPSGLDKGFPFMGFESLPFKFPMQRALSLTQALELSQREWNGMKEQLNHLDSGLGKILDKSTEKPTLRKILISIEERKESLTKAEFEILEQFFATLGRLETVRNEMPIIQVLKEKIDLNTMLSDNVVHSTIHEEITELVKKGVSLRSRFRATISVIPRLLDSLYRMINVERSSASADRSTPPSQAKGTVPKMRSEGQGKSSHLEEEEGGVLLGNLDMEFQMLQHVDEFVNMQRRGLYQSFFARRFAENSELKKETALLKETIQMKDQEIESLKRKIKHGPSDKEEPAVALESEDQKSSTKEKEHDSKLMDIMKRLDLIETDLLSRGSEQLGKQTSETTLLKTTTDQLEDNLKYFRRRLAEYPEKEQSKFIYRSSNFAAGYFDERGGYLDIEALNVSLYVPPGAIQGSVTTEVYIYVDTERQSKPSRDQTVIAPIVQCGPPGLQFRESVVLTFPHCAEETSNWKFSPLTCQSGDNHQPEGDWEHLSADEAICMVDKGRTVLLINHFTSFTLAGEQQEEAPTVKKKMRVGAFGPSFSTGQDSYQFRVRAWNDTEASLDQVLKKENRLSGQQLDDDRQISVANTGQPVGVNMSDLKSGWKNRYDEPDGQDIPFDDLWQQRDVLPSCTFDVEVDRKSNNNDMRLNEGVHCKVSLQQRNSSDDAVKLKLDVKGPLYQVNESIASHSHAGQTFSGAVQAKIFGPVDPNAGLSCKAYYELCEELNMDRGIPRDWRLLADKLGCSFMTIESIRGNRSEEPAKLVLKVFFSIWKCPPGENQSALGYLAETLKEIDLTAAAKIVEDDIKGVVKDDE